MQTALFLRAIGADSRILTFDCGLAGQLAAMNISNNGCADIIKFLPFAICAVDRYVLVHRDIDYSADNRLVNPIHEWARGSTNCVVKGVRLDTILKSESIGAPLIVKIDTQGAEPEVLRGATGLAAITPHALIMEFTPWAIAPRVDPAHFMDDLMARYAIFDIGPGGDELSEQHDASSLVSRTAARDGKWTDLLMLQRSAHNSAIDTQLRRYCRA